ncbi:hypothetical protein BX600DRAFT_516149 [Xylariales sp. PMI_506]|nr:hypothetical protein BX600DRAFT_516149 [Xylariales sp. PMI_506]
MATSSSLSQLPPELLAHVCNFMGTKSQLATFAQCCRQFYDVAASFLYRDVDLLSLPGYDAVKAGGHLEGLARTFQRRPDLGKLVRHLAIRIPEALPVGIEEPCPTFNPDFGAAVVRLMQYIPAAPKVRAGSDDVVEAVNDAAENAPTQGDDGGDGGDEGWDTTSESSCDDSLDGIIPGSWTLPHFDSEAERWIYLAGRNHVTRLNVVMTLLLARLTNLERLDLEMPRFVWTTAFIDRIIAASGARLPPFDESPFLPHLTSVCYGYSAADRRGDAWNGLFLLPSTKAIYLHRLFGGREETPRLLGEASLPLGLEHLELRDCRMRPQWLRQLISVPTSLKSFVYVLGEVHSPAEVYVPISYRSMRLGLEQQRESLERICIEYPHDYSFDPISTQYTAPIGSFSKFTKLKHLRIASTYIFGFVWTEDVDNSRLLRALPEQIETVHLTHADEDEETIEGTEILLDAMKQGRFPEFRELILDASLKWIAENREGLKAIVTTARDVGLRIRLFDNKSDARIEKSTDWINAAKLGYLARERPESTWGYDGEVVWPKRASGCMRKPVYTEIPSQLLDVDFHSMASALQ